MTENATATRDLEATDSATGAAAEIESTDEQALVQDVLVEEVSIDGMCGVY